MPPLTPILPPLAFLPEYPTVMETLGYQAIGLIVVFSALSLIWILLECSGAWFRRLAARTAKQTSAPAKPAPTMSTSVLPASNTEAPIAVIIAAAVHTMLQGRRHRIVAITTAPEHQAWSVEGRRHIFSSHKVR